MTTYEFVDSMGVPVWMSGFDALIDAIDTPSAETAERVYRSNELAQRIGGNQNGAFMKPQSDNSDVVNAISQLGNRVDRMAESISKMKLVLDSGKTVGELAPKIDSNMGGRNILAERGVI